MQRFLFFPHLLIYLFFRERRCLKADLEQWCRVLRVDEKSECANFFWMMAHLKEFRSVFYMRIGNKIASLLRWYAPGMPTCFITTPRYKIGTGFIIQHGHSTRVGAESIGTNCQVWNNVTIGKKFSGGKRPTIGNDVKICTGAIVIGDINIGDGTTIGAGAVVIKNVPPHCVVVGNPARIIKRNGIRVDETL